MSLANIIKRVAGPLGLNPNDLRDRALLIERINFAAEELWESTDLVYSLWENTFSLDLSQQIITLPHYVSQIRGVRNAETQQKVDLNDMRPRYFHGAGWQSTCSWRVLKQGALMRDIENAAPFTVSIPAVDSERFSVTINGRTATSNKVRETIVLETNETSKLFTFQFTDVINFSKSIDTLYDVTLKDADNNILAVIPSNKRESSYKLIQISDLDQSTNESTGCYQILYKLDLESFVEDNDEFTAPGYDAAIIWQTLAHYYATKEGQEILAAGYQGKVAEMVAQKDKDATTGISKPLNVKRNRFISAMGNFAGDYEY